MKNLKFIILGGIISFVFIFSSSFFVGADEEVFSDGDGSLLNPFQIENCEQLQYINHFDNMSESYPYLSSGYHFVLTDDIDCIDTKNWNGGRGFEPIGFSYNVDTYQEERENFIGYFDGADYTISDLYINDPELSYMGLFGLIGGVEEGEGIVSIKNLKIENADIEAYSGVGILAGAILPSVDGVNIIENIHVSGKAKSTMLPVSTYHIYKEIDDNFEEIYTEHFRSTYETKTFVFDDLEDKLTLRINQENLPFAGIDAVSLDACSTIISPSYVINEDDENILIDISSIDNNVVNAHEKNIEVSWDIPEGCESATLSLTANEYNHSLPVIFSNYRTDKYILGTNNTTLNINGFIDEVSDIDPTYISHWFPSTGHPEGETYIYMSDDVDNLYLSFDITSDNTDDRDYDWLKIKLQGKEFKINDEDDTYGKCGFGITDKVSYSHQTCEMIIPKSEFDTTKSLNFIMQYYGTLGYEYTGGLVGFIFDTNITKSSSDSRVEGASNVGGLVGTLVSNSEDFGVITESYSKGIIIGNMNRIGGFIGNLSYGNIINSYSNANVYSYGYESAGGLAGAVYGGSLNPARIINSYSTGDVYAEDKVGGFVGYINDSIVVNSYSTGDVLGTGSVGGFIGYTLFNEGETYIDYIINSGWYNSIVNSNYEVFGIGYTEEDGLSKDVDYKESDTDNFYSSEYGVYGLGDEYDWDFENIWVENRDDYPKLLNNEEPDLEDFDLEFIRLSLNQEDIEGDDHSYKFGNTYDMDNSGRYVVFMSNASNLVSDDINENPDLFLLDRNDNSLKIINIDENGEILANPFFFAISGDGRYVVFEYNLSDDDYYYYKYDISSNTSTLLGNLVGTSFISLSSDGEDIIFSKPLAVGSSSIYKYDEMENSIIPIDLDSESMYRASISRDGRYIVFITDDSILEYDENENLDVYLYDTEDDSYELISLDEDGRQFDYMIISPTISSDGRYIAFTAISGFPNGYATVYLYDREENISKEIMRSGIEMYPLYANSISSDGKFVTFASSFLNLMAGTNLNYTSPLYLYDNIDNKLNLLIKDLGQMSSTISGDGKYINFVSFRDDLVSSDGNNSFDVFSVINPLYQEEEEEEEPNPAPRRKYRSSGSSASSIYSNLMMMGNFGAAEMYRAMFPNYVNTECQTGHIYSIYTGKLCNVINN